MSVRHDHVTWSCELRFHGESWGWEAQILREEELVIGRRFDTRRLAEHWAEEERKVLAAQADTLNHLTGIAIDENRLSQHDNRG